MLEVDADGLLVEVVPQERRADPSAFRIGHGGKRASPRLAVGRVFDLHDIRSEAGQQLGCVGECLHLFGGENPQACERLGARAVVGSEMGSVTEAHRVRVRQRWTLPGRFLTDRQKPLHSVVMGETAQPTTTLRGIISAAGYIPYWRLDRSAIAAFHGGRASGTRSVASYDEDTTTLAVEAGRSALRSVPGATTPETLWFATSSPTYLEKTNATVVHAALRLSPSVGAMDAGGAVRSGVGALRAALRSGDASVLVTASDIRTGPANSPDETSGGDAGTALLIGDASAGPVIAEYLGGASATREFLDRWRAPGDARTKQWEERFGENNYLALGAQAWAGALAAASLDADGSGVTTILIAGPHGRANKAFAKKLKRDAGVDLAPTVGSAGAAEAALQLVAALEAAKPGDVIALVSLADGADVLVFRVTDAIASYVPARTIANQIEAGNAALPYAKFLSWRGTLPINPPNRPEPARASASAAGRSIDWKFGLVGSKDRESGAVHMPPARVSFNGGNVDDMEPFPMADAVGTIMTFTIDRMAYSPSPPVIFAVVDFDPPAASEAGASGGRLPVEICDTTPDGVAVGDRVEMTFRRLNASDGIANYFWKARPVR